MNDDSKNPILFFLSYFKFIKIFQLALIWIYNRVGVGSLWHACWNWHIGKILMPCKKKNWVYQNINENKNLKCIIYEIEAKINLMKQIFTFNLTMVRNLYIFSHLCLTHVTNKPFFRKRIEKCRHRRVGSLEFAFRFINVWYIEQRFDS